MADILRKPDESDVDYAARVVRVEELKLTYPALPGDTEQAFTNRMVYLDQIRQIPATSGLECPCCAEKGYHEPFHK